MSIPFLYSLYYAHLPDLDCAPCDLIQPGQEQHRPHLRDQAVPQHRGLAFPLHDQLPDQPVHVERRVHASCAWLAAEPDRPPQLHLRQLLQRNRVHQSGLARPRFRFGLYNRRDRNSQRPNWPCQNPCGFAQRRNRLRYWILFGVFSL